MSKRTKNMKRNFGFKLFFIDGQGDSKLAKRVLKLAKKYGQKNDMLLLDFDKSQSGLLNPEIGVLTSTKTR